MYVQNTIPSVVPPPTGTSHDDPIQSHAAALSAAGGQQSSDMRVLTESALHEADVTAPAPALMPKRSKKSKKAKNMSKEAQFEALSLHSVEVAPETFETRGEFSTEICDCFVGRGAEAICCTAFLFPCWAHGIIGDAVTEGSGRCSPCMFTCGLYAIYTAGAALVVKGPVAAALMCAPMTVMFGLNVRGRTRMREKYGVRGECCPNGALSHHITLFLYCYPRRVSPRADSSMHR